MANRDTARNNLDRRLMRFRPKEDFARPPLGWIRAIRESIGMTTKQFASRLGVSQPRVIAIEKAEVSGAITLSSLHKIAEAVDCTLVYALVPNESLESLVQDRAAEMARQRMARVVHTMRLENQEPEADDSDKAINQLALDLLHGNPHRLWDDL